MGIEIFEDPVCQNAAKMPPVQGRPRTLPSGRTPLSKRTNVHDQRTTSTTEIGNGNIKKSRKPSQTTSSELDQIQERQRTLRFGERNDPENASLSDFRKKLKLTVTTTPTPMSRNVTTLTPRSLLSTEMDATPEDSLLLSPGAHSSAISHPQPLSRCVGKTLSRQSHHSPSRQMTTKSSEFHEAQKKIKEDNESFLLTKASATKEADKPPLQLVSSFKRTQKEPIQAGSLHENISAGKKYAASVHGSKPSLLSRRIPCASLESNEGSSRNNIRTDTQEKTLHEEKASGVSYPSEASVLSRRVPGSTVERKSVERKSRRSAKVIFATDVPQVSPSTNKDSIVTRPPPDSMALASSQNNVGASPTFYRSRGDSYEPKLEIQTQVSPKIETKPLSTTAAHVSAWKAAAQIGTLNNAPDPSTPGGVCLDLSSMFQKAQSRPAASTMPKLVLESGPRDQVAVASPAAFQGSHDLTPAVVASQAAQQCEIFKAWINATICPDEDAQAESDPWRSLVLHQRMARIRHQARVLWASMEMKETRSIIVQEIADGRLKIRADRDLYSNLTDRQSFLQLLLESYETPWLRLGLETLFGVTIEPGSSAATVGKFDHKVVEKSKLSRMQVTLRDFIIHHFLSDERTLAKYTKGKCKVPSGHFEVEYKTEMRSLVLKRVMDLFFFLDQAKQAQLLEQTLFRTQSLQKSSKQMLTAFCRMFLAHTGDVTKQLKRVGLQVHHNQVPLDELSFAVDNLATDLRDGVRLARLTEVLTASPYQELLKRLRLPAVSRLQKLKNVEFVLLRLSQDMVLPFGLAHHHVVDGYREKVLQLLWTLVANFCLPNILNPKVVEDEIRRIGGHSGQHNPLLTAEEELVQVMIDWTNAVIKSFGLSVANLTTDWADGVVGCLLICFYHPEVLGEEEIRPTKRKGYAFIQKVPKNLTDDSVRNNESENWQLAQRRMLRLGAIAVLPTADSSNPPNERAMLMGLAFLCNRLLESSMQTRASRLLQRVIRRKWRLADLNAKIQAARLIYWAWLGRKHTYYQSRMKKYGAATHVIECFILQRQWQLKYLREQRLQREEFEKAAVLIQSVVRRFIVRREFVVLLARHQAAISIESSWRQTKASKHLRRLRVAAVYLQRWMRRQIYLEHLRQNAAVQIQRIWRGWWMRIEHGMYILDVIDLQMYIRRGLAVLERKRRQNAVAVLQRTFIRYQSCHRAREQRRIILCQRAATVLQACTRRYLKQLHYIELKREYSACRCIQSSWRRFKQRSKFLDLRKQAIVVQAAVRQKIQSSWYHRALKLILVLQSYWRARIARLAFHQAVKSVCSLQTFFRRREAKKEASCRRRAVAVLQCSFRSFQSRKLLAELIAKKRQQASLCIQSWWRKEVIQRNFLSLRHASISVQSFVRSSVGTRGFRQLKRAAVLVQSLSRSKKARLRFVDFRSKIIVCQCFIRIVLAKRKNLARRWAILRLQATFRMCLAKQQLHHETCKRNSAAIAIQKVSRSYLACIRYQSLSKATIAMQSFIRRFLAQTRHRKWCTSALLIQTNFRMRSAINLRLKLNLKLQETIRIKNRLATNLQALSRGYLTRRSIEVRHLLSSRIQNVFRGHKQRMRFRNFLSAAVRLQAHYRRLRAIHWVQERQSAILVLQAAGRMMIAKSEMARRQQQRHEFKAASVLQCAIRSFFARQMFRELLLQRWDAELREDAATIIQRIYRSYITSYKAARQIQKTWRCYNVHVDFLLVILAVIAIQSSVRRLFAQQERSRRQYAVYVLQGFGQTAVQRIRYQRYLYGVIQFQSILRGIFTRKNQDLQHFAAKMIQRTFRGYHARSVICLWQDAALEIQRIWRGFDKHMDYIFTKESIVVIQREMRRFQAVLHADDLRVERVARLLLESTSTKRIQRRFREYQQNKIRKKAATSVQRAWRDYQSRCVWGIIRHGVITLQSLFRGHVARCHRPAKARVIAENLRCLDSQPQQRLGYKTAVAIDLLGIIAKSSMLSQTHQVALTLEFATRLSPVCCSMLIHRGGTSQVFDLMAMCNRSRPHVEILKLLLRTLKNVCRHCGWDDACTESGIEVCLDKAQTFRDNLPIFALAVSLLDAAIFQSARARTFCATPETMRRLQAIHRLAMRKINSCGKDNTHGHRSLKKLERLIEVLSMEALRRSNHQ